MTALGWNLIAVGPLVVAFALPVAQRRSVSQVALTVLRTGIRFVGFEGQP